MHAVAPKQRIRILTIQIAVADEADPDSVADEISELLSENGICSERSHILDWRYLTEYQPVVSASDDPKEGGGLWNAGFQTDHYKRGVTHVRVDRTL